jgi:hypothetical protein
MYVPLFTVCARQCYFFLAPARRLLRASLVCTPAGCSMKRKRTPSTIALYFTAPGERPSSIAASRADFLALAKARIFLRSADVQGALCLRVELAIERIPKLSWRECTNS